MNSKWFILVLAVAGCGVNKPPTQSLPPVPANVVPELNPAHATTSATVVFHMTSRAGIVQQPSATIVLQGNEPDFIWGPSPDSGVAGYNLYYGTATRTYLNQISAGTNLTATVTNLTTGQKYFFACTCYDTNGVESDYSGEAVYVVPAVAKITFLTPGPGLQSSTDLMHWADQTAKSKDGSWIVLIGSAPNQFWRQIQ